RQGLRADVMELALDRRSARAADHAFGRTGRPDRLARGAGASSIEGKFHDVCSQALARAPGTCRYAGAKAAHARRASEVRKHARGSWADANAPASATPAL